MKNNGFSLIEISVVVLIVSVMASSSLSLLGRKNNAEDRSNTRQKLEFISRAIQVYFDKNGKLPCPGRYNSTVNDQNGHFGAAVAGGSSFCVDDAEPPSGIKLYAGDGNKANILGGIVPFIALGISPEYVFDEWGRRITYIVDRDLTKATTYATAQANIEVRDLSYNNPSNDAGDHALWRQPKNSEVNSSVVDCRDETGQTTISPEGDYTTQIPVCVAFALISHGPNGHGAVAANGANFVTSAFARLYEGENYEWENALEPTGLGHSFNDVIIKMPVNEVYSADAQDGGYFDDIVIYREKELIDNQYQNYNAENE